MAAVIDIVWLALFGSVLIFAAFVPTCGFVRYKDDRWYLAFSTTLILAVTNAVALANVNAGHPLGALGYALLLYTFVRHYIAFQVHYFGQSSWAPHEQYGHGSKTVRSAPVSSYHVFFCQWVFATICMVLGATLVVGNTARYNTYPLYHRDNLWIAGMVISTIGTGVAFGLMIWMLEQVSRTNKRVAAHQRGRGAVLRPPVYANLISAASAFLFIRSAWAVPQGLYYVPVFNRGIVPCFLESLLSCIVLLLLLCTSYALRDDGYGPHSMYPPTRYRGKATLDTERGAAANDMRLDPLPVPPQYDDQSYEGRPRSQVSENRSVLSAGAYQETDGKEVKNDRASSLSEHQL